MHTDTPRLQKKVFTTRCLKAKPIHTVIKVCLNVKCVLHNEKLDLFPSEKMILYRPTIRTKFAIQQKLQK